MHTRSASTFALVLLAVGCADTTVLDPYRCSSTACPTATPIYRSVGPGRVTPLATGASGAVEVARGIATFAAELPPDVGVGDVLAYSSAGGSADRVAFVAGRLSSIRLVVQSADGGAPEPTAAADTGWSMFRAYTSLAAAIGGDENPGLPATVADFDPWSHGKDLVSAGQSWNLACYADGPDVTDTVIVRGWVTGPTTFLRIFTPTAPREVGATQRHAGAYDPAKYRLVKSVDGDAHVLDVFAAYVRIEGLQVLDEASASADAGINVDVSGVGDVRVSGTIVRGNPANTRAANGLMWGGTGPSELRVWNSVVSGFSGFGAFDNTASGTQQRVYLYNVTIHDCASGASAVWAPLVAKNDVFSAIRAGGWCILEAGGRAAGSDHDVCNLDEPVTGAHSRGGVAPDFLDAASGDLHLAPGDAVATGEGADLSADPILPFDTDIDGDPRTGAWDIGADQHR